MERLPWTALTSQRSYRDQETRRGFNVVVRPIALPGGRFILSSILESNEEAQIGLDSAVRNDPVGFRIAALHNFCLRIAQILGIKPIADACDGLLPVPSHQLFPSGGLTFTP